MTLHSIAGHRIGEDTDDLMHWLRDLEGCPTVTHTHLIVCSNSVHEEPATWFYVEADPAQGVVRRRCLGCGISAATLDSEERWSHPHMWACTSCGQSIAEVAAGLHSPNEKLDADDNSPGPVQWIAIGVRCVGCGALAGVADLVLARSNYDDVLAAL